MVDDMNSTQKLLDSSESFKLKFKNTMLNGSQISPQIQNFSSSNTDLNTILTLLLLVNNPAITSSLTLLLQSLGGNLNLAKQDAQPVLQQALLNQLAFLKGNDL